MKQDTKKNDTLLTNIYKASLLVRLLFIFFGFGYLHADQFFQSTEIVAGDVFGIETERAWEFDKEHAVRSIFVPAVLSGLPYLVLKVLSVVVNLVNGFTLFYLPRIVCFFASFIVDLIVWDLSNHEMSALATLGTSWVTVIFLLCSFSNTSETLLLAVMLYLALGKKAKSMSRYGLIGAVLALGVFNRFTYALFAFPIILYLLYEELESKEKKKLGWQGLLTGVSSGFAVVSTVLIIIDSVYFGSLAVSIGSKPFRWLDLLDINFYVNLLKNLTQLSISSFTWTIAPINSLRYNSNPDNLAEHGTHWRLTHALINLPILFGPLYVIAILPYYNWLDEKLGELIGQAPKKPRATGKKKIPKVTQSDKPVKGPRKLVQEAESRPKKLIYDLVLLGVIGSGLIFLSFVPHQELRFLVPLLVPFVLLGHKGIFGSEGNKYIQIGWIAFNISLLLIMGVAHQGGMVPSLLSMSRADDAGTHNLIYYHTYMPPKHLLALQKSQGLKPKFEVHDLKGSSLADLRKRILRIHESVQYGQGDKIFIISPGTVDLETLYSELTLKRKFWPHLTFEHLPANFEEYTRNMTLNVYEWNKTK